MRRALLLLLAASPAWAQTPDTALTLQAAARRALDVHPGVRGAAAAAAGAEAGVGEARSRWFPQLATQASLLQFQKPMLVYPIHGFDAMQQSQIVFDNTLIQGTLSLGFTLFDGGARGARIRGARADAAAREAELVATEADLLGDVAGRFLDVLTAGEVLAAQDDGVRALQAERDRVGRLVNEGEAAEVELLRVEAALAQAQAERVAAATRQSVARAGLARAIGRDALPDTLRPVRLASHAVPPRDTLRAALEAHNPRLREADRAVQSARSARRAAVAAWFPQLDAVAGLYAYGSGAGDFTTEWQAGVRLSYPLFVGGARSSAVSRAGALATVAEERYRLATIDAEDALDGAMGAVTESAARVDAVEAVVTHLADVARIELLALESGAGTEVEYLRAEADLRRARSQLAEVRAAEIKARVALANLTGDLSLDWLAQTVETVP
jgi:cobalt-zinc-cadmium efflux system outer membrane protein